VNQLLLQRNSRILFGSDSRIVVPYLETYLSYGCNLRCHFCGNMSPFCSGIEEKDSVLRSMAQWSKRLRPGCFALGGGEPLLHPDFIEIVQEAHEYFSDSEIVVLTNGILFDKISDEELCKLQELVRLEIRISDKGNDGLGNVIDRLQTRQINHTIRPSHFKKLYEVDPTGYPTPASSNPEKAWQHCYANDCRNIIGDTLTYCSRLALIRRALSEGQLDKRWHLAKRHVPMTLENTQEEILGYLHRGYHAECSLCPEQLEDVKIRQLLQTEVEYFASRTQRLPKMRSKPTLENTRFVSVAAYPNPEERCRNLMKSAKRFGIPVTWISWGEHWQGFNHHKLYLLREKCKEWRHQGTEYVFLLDSKDVVFADSGDVILRKAIDIYEPGTLLFNAEWDNHIYPYKEERYKETVKQRGKHLNSGMIFGDIDSFHTIIGHAQDIINGIKNSTPRAGIAEQVWRDPVTRTMWEDDQLTYQMTSVYYPECFRLDAERYLFSWVGILDKPLEEMRKNERGDGYKFVGQASLIHSSSTIRFGSQEMWDSWVQDNRLV
jgi:hypothetical protein